MSWQSYLFSLKLSTKDQEEKKRGGGFLKVEQGFKIEMPFSP